MGWPEVVVKVAECAALVGVAWAVIWGTSRRNS
jgi:hypothetical protein